MMGRLTKKLRDGNFTCECGWNYFEYGDGHLEIFNKLGRIEDLEEELGIPLEVLFKALKEGIIINSNGILRNLSGIVLRYNSYFECCFFEYGMGTAKVKLKDYGKTWALTKEELGNAET